MASNNNQGNTDGSNRHRTFPHEHGREGGYAGHPRTTRSSFDDSKCHHRIQQRARQPSIQQQDDLSSSHSSRISCHSTYPYEGQREVSSLEQNFDDHMFLGGLHHSDDEERPSNDHTPIVTEVHTLKPSKSEMPDHWSYHGDISGQEAEHLLRSNSKRNSYLTRYSKNSQMYMLTVIYVYRNQDRVRNFKLSIDTHESKYSLEGTELVLDTLDKLLEHFEKNCLNHEIRNIGSACLAEYSASGTMSHQHLQQAGSFQSEQVYKELCKVVKMEISKTLRHDQCLDQQSQPRAPLQSQPSVPTESESRAELDLIRDMLKQNQDSNKEVLDRLTEQNTELMKKLSEKKCTIL